MNRAVPRAEIERFTAIMAEKRRRLQRAEHATRGYRDEDGVWRGGLMSFVRDFWHVLEPGTPFVDGWVLHAIAEHLEAVTFGEITNLLINVPPGFSKSLISNCFWPAWEWGPQNLQHLRYVTFSYSSSNTERDNQRFGDLIACPEYQAMYPHVKIRQRGMTMVSNETHGWKLASSVSGSVTGKRGNRAICFPGDQVIHTEFGLMPIGTVVEQRLSIRVPSVDVRTGEVSLKPIIGWHRNPASDLVEIRLSDGSAVRCTPNHRFWDGSGWIEARCLAAGTSLPVVRLANALSDTAPCSAHANGLNCHALDTVSSSQNFSRFGGVRRNLSDLSLSQNPPAARFQECSVKEGVANVLLSCAVFKIVRVTFQGLAIFVTNFLPLWARAKKRLSHQLVDHLHVGLAVFAQIKAQISLRRRAFHDLAGISHVVRLLRPISGLVDCGAFLAEDNPWHAANSPKVTNFVETLEADNRAPFLIVDSVELCGHADTSYCLTVEDNHTFAAGSRHGLIASNCDDLNNVSEAESKTVLEQTNRWFRESLSSRLNNMETDAKIVIAQRTSEGDVSGEILSAGLPYSHLCVPMEFVWQADENGDPYTTQIGWVDPRWRPNAEDCEGELAWPERFSEKVVRALKIEISEYATAAQLQQTPEPRGGGIIKREFWLPAEQYMTDGKYPPLEYIVASLDGAFDVKEENDPSALTIWGIFHNEVGYPRAMLLHAWAKRLPISGPKIDPEPGEHESMYKLRTRKTWGLVEWVADTCNRFKVDRLLIENKASGKPAAQSLQNSHGRAGWSIVLVEPRGDKYARGLAVQPSFSQGMIYAPDREWAENVIDECAVFPRGRHDDLYDSTTQALKHLRDSGLLRSDEDRRAEEMEAVRHKGAPKERRYPGFSKRQR